MGKIIYYVTSQVQKLKIDYYLKFNLFNESDNLEL